MSYIESHQPGWQPPYCPNPNCHFHNPLLEGWPFKKLGFYRRQAKPHRIQRYLCKACGVAFSSQTFSADYWLKRPDILPQLMLKTCGGMANRQIARDLGCAASTVNCQLSRLGRHCLVFHQQLLQGAAPPETSPSTDWRPSSTASSFPSTTTWRSTMPPGPSWASPTARCGARVA